MMELWLRKMKNENSKQIYKKNSKKSNQNLDITNYHRRPAFFLCPSQRLETMKMTLGHGWETDPCVVFLLFAADPCQLHFQSVSPHSLSTSKHLWPETLSQIYFDQKPNMDQADQTSLSSNMGSQLFMLFSWPMPLLGNGMGIVWVEPGQKLRRWVFLSSFSSFSSLSQPATATGAGSVLAQK